MEQKIFGIGLNKTGTSTLALCGRILGLKCAKYDADLIEEVARRDFTRLRKIIEQNDLFEDWPYPLIYKDLDRMYPGSKFILTVRRDEYKWLESYKKHSLYVAPLRFCSRYAYGHFYPHGHEEEHLEFYRKFNAEAHAYFKDRPGDFIEICWEKGDGWEKLCGFLGKDIPGTPVPHTNKGSAYQARLKRRLVNYVFSQYCARRKV